MRSRQNDLQPKRLVFVLLSSPALSLGLPVAERPGCAPAHEREAADGKPFITRARRANLSKVRKATQIHHQYPHAQNRAYDPHVHLRVWEAKLDRERIIGWEGRLIQSCPACAGGYGGWISGSSQLKSGRTCALRHTPCRPALSRRATMAGPGVRRRA